MRDGPHIAKIAALIGDPTRAEILSVLMADRALTATELAAHAGVTPATASAHLGKLLAARLLALEAQGRHRYYRLADRDVARLLESLMGVAFRAGAVRLASSPRDPALRKARVCYDHLAGELAVWGLERMTERRLFVDDARGFSITPAGASWFERLGVAVDDLARERRPLCRACLDWGERRHHLAGALGAALLAQCIERRWARRSRGDRIVRFSPQGERAFRAVIQGSTRGL